MSKSTEWVIGEVEKEHGVDFSYKSIVESFCPSQVGLDDIGEEGQQGYERCYCDCLQCWTIARARG